MYQSSMPRIFALILAVLLLAVGVLRVSAAPSAFTAIRIYDFTSGRPAEWVGTICDWTSYGGKADGPSLLMVGGDACLAGPYNKSTNEKVQILWSGYFVGGGSGGQYRAVILNSSYQLVQQSTIIDYSGGFSVKFPSSGNVSTFYVLFEHVSGVSVHLDDVQIGTYTDPPTATPAPATATAAPSTATPAPTGTATPAPTSTATPAPTATPTPTPTPETENVDNQYKCGGRGWFNWLLCWIVPPPDTFAALQRLWDFLFKKDPFVTVKRLADIKDGLVSAVQAGGQVADISGWPDMIQAGLVFLFYDLLGEWRTVIQALFDATAAILLWKYVTLRLST